MKSLSYQIGYRRARWSVWLALTSQHLAVYFLLVMAMSLTLCELGQ